MMYNALLLWKKTTKTASFPWDFVTLLEDVRATTIGNMHNKFGKDHACGSGNILKDRQTHKQTHTHAQTYLSLYFATTHVG